MLGFEKIMPDVKVSIYNLVTSKEVIDFYNKQYKMPVDQGGYLLPDGQEPFLGDTLFSDAKQMGLDLKWIKGSGGLAVALKNVAFDSTVTHRGRKKAETFMTEMPFFKEASKMNENDRQEINTLIDLSVNNAGYEIQKRAKLKTLFNGFADLIIGAAVTREYMKMDLLSTGTITVVGDGSKYEYDYQLDTWQKITLTGDSKWDAPLTAQPLTDLTNWKKALRTKKGVIAEAIILNTVTLELMKACKQVKDSLIVSGQPMGMLPVTDSRVFNLITAETGLDVYVYDKMAKTDNSTEKGFWPDGVVTMIPRGEIGKMYFGTTPEESDLMRSANIADVNITDVGVAVTVTRVSDPVEVSVKVSQICLPSGENMDKVIIAKVVA